MLPGRTRFEHEQLITARPVAGKSLEIFRNFCCALALARCVRAVRCRGLAFPPPLSIPAALRSTALLAMWSATIGLCGSPAAPAPRSRLARRTAVAALRPCRLKPAFAAFQQATSGPRRLGSSSLAALTCRFVPPRVQRVHGSQLLPTDQVSGRSCHFFPRRFPPSVQLRRNDAAAALLGFDQSKQTASLRKPAPSSQSHHRDRLRAAWHCWLRESGPVSKRY